MYEPWDAFEAPRFTGPHLCATTGDGVARAGEGRDERISRDADLVPAAALIASRTSRWCSASRSPKRSPSPIQQVGGTLHVREQEGDRVPAHARDHR